MTWKDGKNNKTEHGLSIPERYEREKRKDAGKGGKIGRVRRRRRRRRKRRRAIDRPLLYMERTSSIQGREPNAKTLGRAEVFMKIDGKRQTF